MQTTHANAWKELIERNGFRPFPMPEKPTYIAFCDFDESYFPHHRTADWQESIRRLEEFIFEKSEKEGLMIGLVTGSRLNWVFEKMVSGGYRFAPHFIASAFGTQIHYFTESEMGKMDEEWKRHIAGQGYTYEKIEEILRLLREKDIVLKRQEYVEFVDHSHSYYYFMKNEDEDKKNIEYIRKLAASYGITVNISRCNPYVGDPENAYDVDFISRGAGKEEIVKFILKKFAVDRENSFAFGDSGNDLKMLRTVGNGYLLANATEEAKRKYNRIAEGPYTDGIYKTLKNRM